MRHRGYDKYGAGYVRQRSYRDSGNFSRSRAAAQRYYAYGANAAKIEEARDDVALKYYGKLVKIENVITVRNSFAKILCALVVCACAIIVIFSRSVAYNYQLENTQLRTLLETERDKTESIIAASAEKIDMAYVEEIATTRLNMSKPQSYQIFYIEVPKTEYTVNHGAATVAVEKETDKLGTYRSIITNLKEAGEAFLKKETEAEEGNADEG